MWMDSIKNSFFLHISSHHPVASTTGLLLHPTCKPKFRRRMHRRAGSVESPILLSRHGQTSTQVSTHPCTSTVHLFYPALYIRLCPLAIIVKEERRKERNP